MREHGRKRRLTGVALVATAAMLVLAACGNGGSESTSGTEVADGWEAIEDAARDEGQLVIYTAVVDAINEPLFEAFNEEYPEIEIVHTRLASGELTTRYSSERESGAATADLIVIADTLMLTDKAEWFAELTDGELPNLGDWNADYRADNFVHFMAGQFGITYNADKMSDVPETWDALTSSELAKKGMLNEPGSGGSYMALYALLREKLGDSYLEDLGKSGQTYYDSSTTAIQQVGAGQYAFNAPSLLAHSEEARAAGAPLEFQPLTPPIALTHIGAINSSAKNPNAARVYLNWLLSENGQKFACGGGQYSTLGGQDLDDCKMPPADLEIVDTVRGQEQADEVNALMGTN